MLIDTGFVPATSVSATAPAEPSLGRDATSAARESAVELVGEIASLVDEMGLAADVGWVAASAAVAGVAGALRSSVILMAAAGGPAHRSDVIDSVPVPVSAPPVVRAREVGFLSSRLSAMLGDVGYVDVDGELAVDRLIAAITDRLDESVRDLRGALSMDASVGSRRSHLFRR